MKTQDIFSLALRLLGLFFIYLAVEALPPIFAGPPARILFSNILGVAIYVGVGWWLLGGAPMLMHRAYPEANSQLRREDLARNMGAQPEA